MSFRPITRSSQIGGAASAASRRIVRALRWPLEFIPEARRVGACVLGLAACLALGLAAVQAEDRITLRRGSGNGRVVITGYVEDYTGRDISIRNLQSNVVKKYSADEVLEVVTPHSASHARGLQLLAENSVAEAIPELETALKQADRAWQRRELLAILIRAGVRQGDYARAGLWFQIVADSDPSTRHFPLIPLIWSPQEINESARTSAQDWLLRSGEVPQLIGASLLLDDPRFTAKARAVLKTLSTSADDRVRFLAQTQSWRLELADPKLSKLQIEHWRTRVEALPQELRSGPYFLLGRAYAASRDHELAAAAYLWLPLVDDHDYNLAARACLEAGASLSLAGQPREAETLYREVVQRFETSPCADEARQLLAKSRSGSAGTPQEEF